MMAFEGDPVRNTDTGWGAGRQRVNSPEERARQSRLRQIFGSAVDASDSLRITYREDGSLNATKGRLTMFHRDVITTESGERIKLEDVTEVLC